MVVIFLKKLYFTYPVAPQIMGTLTTDRTYWRTVLRIIYGHQAEQTEVRCKKMSNAEIINPLKTKRRLLYLKTQFVPRSKHFSSRL